MHARSQLIDGLEIPEDRWVTFVHPSATVAKNVGVGEGVFIGQNAVLQPGTRVDRHVSIRAGANSAMIVDVRNLLRRPRCQLRECRAAAWIPCWTECRGDRWAIRELAVVGAGTVVTKRVPPDELHFGVPARGVGRIPSEGPNV